MNNNTLPSSIQELVDSDTLPAGAYKSKVPAIKYAYLARFNKRYRRYKTEWQRAKRQRIREQRGVVYDHTQDKHSFNRTLRLIEDECNGERQEGLL